MDLLHFGFHSSSDHHCALFGCEMFVMKIKVTNRLGLPQAIVHAVSNDPYDPGDGDYTVTGLLKPPRMAVLSRGAEIVEDAADKIYSLQGQLMHYLLERAGHDLRAEGFVVEKRFTSVFTVDGKEYRVSAQVDLFDPKAGTLSDYKYTSVGAAKHGLKEDHRLQLNVQAELLRKAGHTVNQAEVVLLLRDWSAERTYDGYPESPALKQTVIFMTSAEVDAWIVERIRLHEAAKIVLPECTQEERWSRPKFAVMKSTTAARATRVFESRAEAEEFLKEPKGQGQSIVERPGEDVRCLRYCPARNVCSQAAKIREALGIVSAPIVDDDMIKVSGK